jgi:hypothetical protein
MTVIPKRSLGRHESGLVKYLATHTRDVYRLAQCIELVQEALERYKRTLRNEGRTVDIIRVMLEDTMPMLQK